MDKLFAGIDLGTSGCRLIVIDSEATIQSSTSIAYQHTDKQTPELWWNTVCKLVSDLPVKLKTQIQSLSIDGTSGTLLLTDSSGNPTSSALMYHDLRAIEEAETIKQVMPLDNGGQGASGSLARLMWLLKHEPSPEHAHALHQADFILGKLSHDFTISDENNCLKLGYDSVNRCWPEKEILELGLNLSMFPKVYPAGTSVALIDKKIAQLLGLSESLQLATGTTDSIAAFIATGAKNRGEAVTSLGSTLVLKLLTDNPIFSHKHGVYSHRLGDQWLVGGASNTGGNVIQKYFSQQQITDMTMLLSPDKTTGLEYYPLCEKGERFPIADANRQAQLLPRPESDIDYFQGILEGIANIEKQGYKKLSGLGANTVTSIRTVGGGCKNKAWTHIRKRSLNVEMITPKNTEAAYGSALLALQAYKNRNEDND